MDPRKDAAELINKHYIQNYASFAEYDINSAKKNAIITVKHTLKFFRNLYKTLLEKKVVQNENVEESSIYKYWMSVIDEINKYTIQDLIAENPKTD